MYGKWNFDGFFAFLVFAGGVAGIILWELGWFLARHIHMVWK